MVYWLEGKDELVELIDFYIINKVEVYMVKFIVDEVEFGLVYEYELWINGWVVELDYFIIF